MRQIVLSTVIAIALTVGSYHIAFLAGSRDPVSIAYAVAFIAAVVLAVSAAVVFAISNIVGFSIASGGLHENTPVAVVVVCIISLTVGFVVVPAFAVSAAVAFAVSAFAISTVVIAVVFTISAAVLAVITEHVFRYRWAFVVYGIEALAIWGALAVGSVDWSIAIALGGIVLLLVFWRVAS